MPIKKRPLEEVHNKVRHQRAQWPKKSNNVRFVPTSKVQRPLRCLYLMSAEIDVIKRKPPAKPQTFHVPSKVPVIVITSDDDNASSTRQTERNKGPVTSCEVLAGTFRNPIGCDPPVGSSPVDKVDLSFSEDGIDLQGTNKFLGSKRHERINEYQPEPVGPEAGRMSRLHLKAVDPDPTPSASTTAAREQPDNFISNLPSRARVPPPPTVLQQVAGKPPENGALSMDTSNEEKRSPVHKRLFQSAKESQSIRAGEPLTKAHQARNEAEILVANMERYLLRLENRQRQLLERRDRLKRSYPAMVSKRKDYQDVRKMLAKSKVSMLEPRKCLDFYKMKRQEIQNQMDLLQAPVDLGIQGENALDET